MSIIIKNLDMPTGCQKCNFFRKRMFGNGLDYSYSCILGATEFPMPWIRHIDNRASDCPIVEAEPKTGEWIPCSERLPNEERHYLCCNKGYLPFTAHYHDGQWHCIDGTTHVDAWMPLPKPYREDGK